MLKEINEHWRLIMELTSYPPLSQEANTAGTRPRLQGGYVETKQPTYPREGRCWPLC